MQRGPVPQALADARRTRSLHRRLFIARAIVRLARQVGAHGEAQVELFFVRRDRAGQERTLLGALHQNGQRLLLRRVGCGAQRLLGGVGGAVHAVGVAALEKLPPLRNQALGVLEQRVHAHQRLRRRGGARQGHCLKSLFRSGLVARLAAELDAARKQLEQLGRRGTRAGASGGHSS